MFVRIDIPVDLKIESKSDLPKLKEFMEHNHLKLNKSEIARQLNMDRRTVSKYLDGFEKKQTKVKESRMTEYHSLIHELLSSPSQIFSFRSVLFQYLKDNYQLDISKSAFYAYLKTIPEFEDYFSKSTISKFSKNPILRFETPPGLQAQLDWKESIPFVLKDTKETIKIHVLVLILGHSRFRIYKPAIDMTQATLQHLLVEMFETMGGVPKELLTDNMKTVMQQSRTVRNAGILNRSFEAFVKDFGFVVKPCIAASPQTKGKVESQMKYLEEIRAYSGKLTLVELYEQISRMNRRINNSICQGTGRIPMLDFEKEKDFLLPLPHERTRNLYRIQTRKVKVNRASMVSIQSNLYSVPTKYIGEDICYQIHDSKVYLYFNTNLIAVHRLSTQKLNYTQEHYTDILKSNYKGKSPDAIQNLAKENLRRIGGYYHYE